MSEQIARARAAAQDILDAARVVVDALADVETPPGELAPPAEFTAEFDPVTRKVTSTWAAQADVVEYHELAADPENTLKESLARGVTVRVSSELRGGHEYVWAARSRRGNQVSEFVTRVMYVPRKGEQPGGEQPDEEEPPVAGAYPLDVLTSKAWKLTTTFENPEAPGKVLEIFRDGRTKVRSGGALVPADLDTYTDAAHWRLNDTGTAIAITCPFDGFTTKSSSNVRWELRQMLADGTDEVEWSTTDGKKHRLVVDTQIDELAANHIVFAQFHGGDDDLTVGRAEPNADGRTFTIWITHGDTPHGYKAAEAVPLGQRFRFEMESDGAGGIHYWLDGAKVPHVYEARDSSVYGKAGLYLQRKGRPGSQGRVTLYDAYMTAA
jgi:hypothetical protein